MDFGYHMHSCRNKAIVKSQLVGILHVGSELPGHGNVIRSGDSREEGSMSRAHS